MHGFLFLCDHAETLNGKLYVQGGGWSRIGFTGEPITVFIAGKVFVPWNLTNRKSPLRVALFTEDGQPVVLDNGAPVEIAGEFEMGRPPGVTEGIELDMPLTFKFQGLALTPARYRWELHVGGKAIASVPFDVVAIENF